MFSGRAVASWWRGGGHSSTEMLFKVYSRYIPNLTRMDGSAFERLIQSRVIENDKEVGNETE